MSEKIKTGGPAFPCMPPCTADGTSANGYPYPEAGMTLRDYFALNLPADEIRDVVYHSLSREAQEKLTGMKCPVEPAMNHGGGFPADYFIEKAKFQAAVNAALRFMAADAMLAARGE